MSPHRGRAEMEAEIAALKAERGALRESLGRLLAEAQEVEHIRCLQVVEQQISRFTGPTGGWLDSPKEVFAEIAVNMLHRVGPITPASGEPARKP